MNVSLLPRSVLIFTLVCCSSGCATIFNQHPERLIINSDPIGADVKVDGVLLGQTPLSIELSVKEDHLIELDSPGCETAVFQLESSVGGGWIVLDILFGLLPLIVDGATENWYELDSADLALLRRGLILEHDTTVSASCHASTGNTITRMELGTGPETQLQ